MIRLTQFLPRSTLLGVGQASVYTIAAGVFVAVCQVLNQLLVTGTPARAIVAVVVSAAATYGIQPLFGPALTTVAHIPSNVLFFLAAAISGGNGVLAALSMSTDLHAVFAGVLTLVGAVFFGSPILVPPSPTPVTPTPTPATGLHHRDPKTGRFD